MRGKKERKKGRGEGGEEGRLLEIRKDQRLFTHQPK
jgi:hypothetical protein